MWAPAATRCSLLRGCRGRAAPTALAGVARSVHGSHSGTPPYTPSDFLRADFLPAARAFESSHHAEEGHKRYHLPAALVERGILDPRSIVTAPSVEEADVLRVHCAGYVRRFEAGEFSAAERRATGLQWSPALVRRVRAVTGGTVCAAFVALRQGVGINLGGGAHHAFRDRGAGYCIYNDEVIAMKRILEGGLAGRVLVVDLDTHQGDGTAALTAGDERIFTFSMHGERNFPLRKQTSTVDIALPDGTKDGEYLRILEEELKRIVDLFSPDMIFFQSGIDVLEGDRLGRLSLSMDGLRERDRLVFAMAQRLRVPLVMTLGGGYQRDVRVTIGAHCQAISLLQTMDWSVCARPPSPRA